MIDVLTNYYSIRIKLVLVTLDSVPRSVTTLQCYLLLKNNNIYTKLSLKHFMNDEHSVETVVECEIDVL